MRTATSIGARPTAGAKCGPRPLRVLAVEREYDDGRVTSLADSEVDALIEGAFAQPVSV